MSFPYTSDEPVDDESAAKFMQSQIDGIAEMLLTRAGPHPKECEEAVRVYRYLMDRLKMPLAKPLKLFEITNGYQGFGPVRSLVIADSETVAMDIARPFFKDNGPTQPSKYWEHLEARVLTSDLNSPWFGGVED